MINDSGRVQGSMFYSIPFTNAPHDQLLLDLNLPIVWNRAVLI